MGGSGGVAKEKGGEGPVLRVKEKADYFEPLPNFESFRFIF